MNTIHNGNPLSMPTTNLDKMLKQFNREWIGVERYASRYFQDSPLNTSNYPPYNIEKFGEDKYQITIAIAGFSKDDVEITVENSLLTIIGEGIEKDDDEGNSDFLYQGIANRDFKLRFTLADYVEVKEAKFENGLLGLSLERNVPEAMKPKTIEIK